VLARARKVSLPNSIGSSAGDDNSGGVAGAVAPSMRRQSEIAVDRALALRSKRQEAELEQRALNFCIDHVASRAVDEEGNVVATSSALRRGIFDDLDDDTSGTAATGSLAADGGSVIVNAVRPTTSV